MNTNETRERLLRAGRNQGPELLLDWMIDGTSTEDVLREVILLVWGLCEWPARALDEEIWLEWFYELGFLTDQPDLGPPKSPVTVWRGAPLASGPRGFSWSDDIEIARWFASRWVDFGRGPGGVWEAVIPPAGVLAVHDARDGEREVIVDPTRFDEDDLCHDIHLKFGLQMPRLIEKFAKRVTSRSRA